MQSSIRYWVYWMGCLSWMLAGVMVDAQTSDSTLLSKDGVGQYSPAVFDGALLHLEKTSQTEQSLEIAQVLMDKAQVLAVLGDQEAELKTYDTLLHRFEGVKNDINLQELLAQAWFNKGVLFEQIGSLKSALKAYQNTKGFLQGVATKTALDLKSKASLNEGMALLRLRQDKAALSAFDRIIANARHSAVQQVEQALVVKAMLGRGLVYTQQGQLDKALDTYDSVITGLDEKENSQSNPALEPLRRAALLGKVTVLERLWQLKGVGFTEVLPTYDLMLKGLPPHSLEAVLVQGMRADVSLKEALTSSKAQHFDRALQVYDKILFNLDKNNEPVLQVFWYKALLNKGFVLWELGELEQSLQVYDSALSGLMGLKSKSSLIQNMLAAALFSKATVLGKMQRPQDQLDVYGQLEQQFSQSQKTEIQDLLLTSLMEKGAVLAQMNRFGDAVNTVDAIWTYFGYSDNPKTQVQVVTALLNKALLLRVLKRDSEELGLHSQILARFADTQNPKLKPFLVQALHNRGFLYLLEAKKQWGNQDVRTKALAQAVLDFEAGRNAYETAAVPKALKMSVLQGLAYALYVQGQVQQADALLQEAAKLSIGATGEYDSISSLIALKPAPPEEVGMQALINKALTATTISNK